MTRYVAMIDGKKAPFGLVFPDAPGCTAMGDTIEEVLQNGSEALADWMGYRLAEGRALPKARTVEQLRKDPEVLEDLATGSVFVLVPLVLDTGRATRANISLDAGLLAAIDEAARQQKVTRSAFLAAAARDKIKATA
jgi:predicted RNase H-like HicB family nuclease